MDKLPSRRSSKGDIETFLKKSQDLTRFTKNQPRLLFCIDATASRQPTWDQASHLQQEMFGATDIAASLAVQLCYYRGFKEFFASSWLSESAQLARIMRRVRCEGGHTQIARLLRHALAEHTQKPVRAVVFIGDAMEENADTLCQLAGDCGLRKLPLFLFQEGSDPAVEANLRTMSRISGGAYARFDTRSADTLAALLGAVASYASGGQQALEKHSSGSAKLLLQQLKN